MRKILVSPHNDDAALFAAFTCIEHRPLVLTVFDSYIQPQRMAARPIVAERCGKQARRMEDMEAMRHLGCDIRFLGFNDATDEHNPDRILREVSIYFGNQDVEIWAPLEELGGHAQHNIVARAFDGMKVHRYPTYTRDGGRTKRGDKVNPVETSWVLNKLRALACYESQISIPELGCWPWFIGDQTEYIFRAKA